MSRLIVSFIIIISLPLLAILNAGFDHDIVYYLLALGLGGMTILWERKDQGISLDKGSPLLYYLLFLTWAGISIFWSIHYVRTLVEFLQLTLLGLVLLYSSQLDEEGRIKTIKVVGLFSALIAILGILEYVFVRSGRIVSTFTNPNPFGTYLLILFLFFWGFALRERKGVLVGASLVYIVAFLLTGSRGAYLSLFVALPFLFVSVDRKEVKGYIVRTGAMLGAGLGITRLLMYLAPIVQKNLGLDLSLIDNLLRVSSLVGTSSLGRLEFWKTAGRVFMDRPLTGYGLGTFFQSYYIGYGGNQWFSRFAHNHYLQLLAELGIVGLILFIAFILSVLWMFIGIARKKDYPAYFIGIIAAFIGLCAHIFIEFSWNFPAVPATALWMVGMAMSFRVSENPETRIKPALLRTASALLLLLTIWHFGSTKAYLLGINYAEEEQLDKSIQVFDTVNTIYPINSKGWQLNANNHYNSYTETGDVEDLDKAISLMTRALKRAPYDSEIHSSLAKLHHIAGDYENAEKYYISGARYAAYVTNRYVDLAQFYVFMEEYKKAEKVLLDALDLKDFMIRAAGRDQEEVIKFNTASINIILYEVYSRIEDQEGMDEQRAEIESIGDEIELFWQYYDKERFGL